MLKPEDVLKNQLANVLGENANLVCKLDAMNQELQLARKQLAELSIPKEDPVPPKEGVPGGVEVKPKAK